jgi:putative FmdB family regulatory protein
MPVYEYQCKNCYYRFELKQSFNDDSIVTCPQCASKAKRIFSPVPIIFKGSGFYTTDSRQTKDKTSKPEVKPDSSKHKLSG